MKNENFENLKKLGNSADQFVGNSFNGITTIVLTILFLVFATAGVRILIWLFQQLTGAA